MIDCKNGVATLRNSHESKSIDILVARLVEERYSTLVCTMKYFSMM